MEQKDGVSRKDEERDPYNFCIVKIPCFLFSFGYTKRIKGAGIYFMKLYGCQGDEKE